MATPNVGILTTTGKALIDKVNSGQAKISFSKVVFSSMDNSQLSDTQIKALTAIAPQEVVVSSPQTTLDTNSGETRIRATGTNEKLADGVYVKTYGVFAKDDTGNEILYGVTVSPNPNYFPAYDGVTPQAVTYSYKTVIQETSNITMTNSNDVYVSQEDLTEAIAKIPQPDLSGYDKTDDVDKKLQNKQDKLGFTAADDSKVVHDNGNGTIQVNGTRVNPYNKLTDTIGGRNVIMNSASDIVITSTSSNWNYVTLKGDFVAGKVYTISAEITLTGSSNNLASIWVNGPDIATNIVNTNSFLADGNRNSWTFTIPSGASVCGIIIYAGVIGNTAGIGAIAHHVKVEQGSVPTDWSPAPEDKVNVADMRKPASDVVGLEDVSQALVKTALTDQTDLDTVTTSGIYPFNNIHFVNFIDTVQHWGYLEVVSQGGIVCQTIYIDYNSSTCFQRKQVGYPAAWTTWVEFADDSKVAHLSGANNFDTVPTVNNNPLLLASSLPSDLARTSQQTNFTAGLQSNGQDVLTVKTPGVPNLAVKYNATSKAFDYTLTAPEKDGFSDILQYNLLWKDHSVDDWTTVVVKPDNLTGQLTGVDIPKTYDFKAAAQNAVGSSDYTDVITLGTVDGNVYGASWDGSSSGALQRTDAAVGLKAGINGAQNDFDTRGPWGSMDKTVTDSYGNAFVRVPKFYIRKTQNKTLSTWQVSLVKQGDDWYLPNCFYDFDNKEELDYVDVSRYEGSIASGKLQSKTGVTPAANQTIIQLRSSAVANNTNGKKGYHLWDMHTLDALQTLFTIEFATLDSQSIMQGNDSGANLINTGATDNVKGSSGFVTSGSTSMAYRGIENLYGNLAMFTDGLNTNNLSLYSCDDATKFASDVFASPYYKLNYSLNSGNENITGLGFDKDHPGVTAPTSFNSDSYNTYYHDYGYVNGSGNYVVHTGGGWGWVAGGSGLWFWHGGLSSTGADSRVGSRLLKKAL